MHFTTNGGEWILLLSLSTLLLSIRAFRIFEPSAERVQMAEDYYNMYDLYPEEPSQKVPTGDVEQHVALITASEEAVSRPDPDAVDDDESYEISSESDSYEMYDYEPPKTPPTPIIESTVAQFNTDSRSKSMMNLIRENVILSLSVVLTRQEKAKLSQILKNPPLKQAEYSNVAKVKRSRSLAKAEEGLFIFQEALKLASEKKFSLDQLTRLLESSIPKENSVLRVKSLFGLSEPKMSVVDNFKEFSVGFSKIDWEEFEARKIDTEGKSLGEISDDVFSFVESTIGSKIPRAFQSVTRDGLIERKLTLTLSGEATTAFLKAKSEAELRNDGTHLTWIQIRKVLLGLEDKIWRGLKARPLKKIAENERGIKSEMSLEEIKTCLRMIKGRKSEPSTDAFDRGLLKLNESFSASRFVSTNSTDEDIKKYLALTLGIGNLYELTPKQTILLIQSNLVGGLEDVVSIMYKFGLELNFVVKFFMGLVVNDTKLKEMQRFYENYEPRGKDTETVLNEVKEMVMFLFNEEFAKTMNEGLKERFRAELFFHKMEKLLHSSFLNSLKRTPPPESKGSLDALMTRIKYRSDVLDKYFLEGPGANSSGTTKLSKEVEDLVDLQIGSENLSKDENNSSSLIAMTTRTLTTTATMTTRTTTTFTTTTRTTTTTRATRTTTTASTSAITTVRKTTKKAGESKEHVELDEGFINPTNIGEYTNGSDEPEEEYHDAATGQDKVTATSAVPVTTASSKMPAKISYRANSFNAKKRENHDEEEEEMSSLELEEEYEEIYNEMIDQQFQHHEVL